MNNGFFPMGFLNKEMYQALSQNDMPPTLYSLMNSYVNFNRTEDNKVAIIDLPNAFKNYLFDFNYPLDNTLKADFEENFLTHYMFRRIGFETYMRFKIHLKDKLNQIMPKFNTMLSEFDNLDFLGTSEVHTRRLDDDRTGSYTNTNSSSNQSSGSSSTTSDNRYSDTPENQLTDVQNGTYLTDYTYNTQTGSSSATASGTATVQNYSSDNIDVSETINIHRGDSTDEYIKFQDKLMNIYSLIYKELDSLFYGII